MFSKIAFILSLLATSSAGFNGQATTSFVAKQQSQSALQMSGGQAAPALKVSIETALLGYL